MLMVSIRQTFDHWNFRKHQIVCIEIYQIYCGHNIEYWK